MKAVLLSRRSSGIWRDFCPGTTGAKAAMPWPDQPEPLALGIRCVQSLPQKLLGDPFFMFYVEKPTKQRQNNTKVLGFCVSGLLNHSHIFSSCPH